MSRHSLNDILSWFRYVEVSRGASQPHCPHSGSPIGSASSPEFTVGTGLQAHFSEHLLNHLLVSCRCSRLTHWMPPLLHEPVLWTANRMGQHVRNHINVKYPSPIVAMRLIQDVSSVSHYWVFGIQASGQTDYSPRKRSCSNDSSRDRNCLSFTWDCRPHESLSFFPSRCRSRRGLSALFLH